MSNNQTSRAKSSSPVLKPLTKSKSRNIKALVVVFSTLVIIAGVATGWFLSGGTTSKSGLANINGEAAPGVEKTDGEVGFDDDTAFPDEAEGVLEKGGIQGEGTYHLVREGGETQYVYLTSTVIDLGAFEGKKVQVWGETIAARNAPWLMDVGRIKSLD